MRLGMSLCLITSLFKSSFFRQLAHPVASDEEDGNKGQHKKDADDVGYENVVVAVG